MPYTHTHCGKPRNYGKGRMVGNLEEGGVYVGSSDTFVMETFKMRPEGKESMIL